VKARSVPPAAGHSKLLGVSRVRQSGRWQIQGWPSKERPDGEKSQTKPKQQLLHHPPPGPPRPPG